MGREAKTALIQKENGNLYTYTEGDTLFPGTYNYHILGEFDGNRSPTFQGDAFFYYPLADITDLQGLLFTNVDSGESLSELTSIVEKTGRSIEYQTYTDSNLNILEVLKKMFMDDFVSRSLLFAFLGLVFCAVFAMSMMYRESNRFMVIHHLYGAAYAYLFVRLLLRLMCIAVLGTGLGYILGRTQLYLIHRAAYLNVAVLSGVCQYLVYMRGSYDMFPKLAAKALRNGGALLIWYGSRYSKTSERNGHGPSFTPLWRR